MEEKLEMVDSDEVLDLVETAETIEIIELKKVIKNGKEEIKTITIDTSEITPKMIIEAGKDFSKANPGFVGLKELNEEYALMVASKLLNIEYASLLKLNTSDFFTVSRTISSFLMKGE